METATLIEEGPKCPKCGMKMIKRYEGYVLTLYPAQYPWYWWCGCGHTEEGGIEVGETEPQSARKEWEILNNII